MRHLLMIVTILMCVVLLAGCGCQHQWEDASCTKPKTCILCQQTEGEPLGHQWQEADCEKPKHCGVCALTEGEPLGHVWQEADCGTPKTCTVCASQEGEALGHCYGLWEVQGETMSRTCETCGFAETADADRERILSDLLVGRWDARKLRSASFSDMEFNAEDLYKGPIPHMIVNEDHNIQFFNGKEYLDGTLHFSEYMEEGGTASYIFFAEQDGALQMVFALEISPEGDCAVYGYETYYTVRYEKETEEAAAMRQALVGTWNSTKKKTDSTNDTGSYTGCTLTLRDDHSFTMDRDGVEFQGTWGDPERTETDEYTLYVYNLDYKEDGYIGGVFLQMIDWLDADLEVSINFHNEYTLWFEAE